jgi:hypothetical protein
MDLPNKIQSKKEDVLDIATKPLSASEPSVTNEERGIGKRELETTDITFQRPSLHIIVSGFRERRGSPAYCTRVIGSSQASMGHDLRAAVAACNNGRKA